MPTPQSSSVSLKINRTSVMLYANRYVRLPEGVGATTQKYLGSFSVNATEVPERFEMLLQQATQGRPERYLAIIERITRDVLLPARERQELKRSKEQCEAIGQALGWATHALRLIPAMANYAAFIRTPGLQSALSALLAAAEPLAGNIEPAIGREADKKSQPEVALLW